MLVDVGRYLEARARGQAMSAMAALARRAPTTAQVTRSGRVVEVPVNEVVVNDVVQILPHTSVPTDGEIIDGRVTLDESLLTGEPLPVTRGPGEGVRAGTIVVEGVATFRATQVGQASTLGRIV